MSKDKHYKQVISDENLSNLYKDTLGEELVEARKLADKVTELCESEEDPPGLPVQVYNLTLRIENLEARLKGTETVLDALIKLMNVVSNEK